MAITAAIMGGGALLGGIAGAMGSGDQTMTTENTMHPGQDRALTELLQFGQPLAFDLSKQAGDFFGSQPSYAGMTPEMQTFIQNSQIAGSSGLQSFSDLSSVIGAGQAGAFGAGQDAYSQFLQQSGNLGAGGGSDFATSGINRQLSNLGLLGTETAAGAFGDLSNLGGRAQDIFGRAGDIGSVVNQFMNEGDIQAQIDAVSRDVTRNLTEEELPALARIGRGNIGNSNLGQQATLSTSRAQDRLADISASIRSGQRDRALGLAQGLDQSGLQTALSAAAGAGQLGSQTALGASRAGVNAVSNQIDALRNLGTGANMGFGQGAQSLGTLGGAINTTLGGYGALQGDQNAAIQAAIQHFLTGQGAQMMPLNQFSSIIGPLATTGTTQTTSGPGAAAGFFGGALGGLGMGASLLGSMNTGAQPAIGGFGGGASQADISRQLSNPFRGMAPTAASQPIVGNWNW